MIKKKIFLCLVIIMFALSNIFFVDIEAKEIISLEIYQDKDHIATFYKGKPNVNAGQDIQNLNVTYIPSTNTYELKLLGDVTLNPVLCSAISSTESNIEIIGNGVLTINYSATIEELKKIDDMGWEYIYEEIGSLIFCQNKEIKSGQQEWSLEKLYSITIGKDSEIEEEKSNITLHLNTVVEDEIIDYLKSDEAKIHQIQTFGLYGDNVFVNNTSVNINGIAFNIKAENEIVVENSSFDSKYIPGYYKAIIGTYSVRGKTVFDNSDFNITMEDDNDYESFCTAHYTDSSTVDIINGSSINVVSPYREAADASLIWAQQVNIEDSECTLIGSWISLICDGILIENSDFLFDAYYANIALFNSDSVVKISEDDGHGGILKYKKVLPDFPYNGLIIYADVPSGSMIDIDKADGIKMYAGEDENNKIEISSIDDIVNNTTYQYFEIEKKCSISFIDGDSELKEYHLTVSPNNKIIKPEDPIKEGYKFEGWYSDQELTIPYNFNDVVTKNMKLYAKWSIIEEEPEEEKQEDVPYRPYIVPKTGIK